MFVNREYREDDFFYCGDLYRVVATYERYVFLKHFRGDSFGVLDTTNESIILYNSWGDGLPLVIGPGDVGFNILDQNHWPEPLESYSYEDIMYEVCPCFTP